MDQRVQRSILILLLTGCATARPPVTTPAASVPPQPIIESSDNGPWFFTYRSDTTQYQISRTATIESQTDSGLRREITTNNSHEVVILTPDSLTIHYNAAVDTFSTGTQGLIGSVPEISLPIQVSGIIDSIGALPDSVNRLQVCNPVESNLQSDVRNLLIKFPAQLATGLSWRDSSARTVCYGTIPMQAVLVRKFSVIGKTSYNGQSAVTVQRVDSVSAQGEGSQQQHRLAIEAMGTGAATYYLSPEQGLVLHLTTSQNVDFVIRVAARASQFHESVTQEYSLTR